MIRRYGLPRVPMSHHWDIVFLGTDVNGTKAPSHTSEIYCKTQPWLVTYPQRLLKPWWIEIAWSRVLNSHSAVLPYARGMYAIEDIAASQKIEAFRNAVGVTTQFIDDGIDTGPIVRAERLGEPFRLSCIRELKALLYRTGIESYISTVRRVVESRHTIPAGVYPGLDVQGPNYLKKRFTEEKERQAEAGYLWTRFQVSSRQLGRSLVLHGSGLACVPLRRLPETNIPNGAGFSLACKERQRAHSRALCPLPRRRRRGKRQARRYVC